MDAENELIDEAAEAAVGADQRTIVGQTGQNVLGLAIGATATFAAQVLMSNRLGAEAFGVVTLATQFAFIAAAATRFGMDVANVRLVAILVGKGDAGRARGLVARAVGIALTVSVPFAVLAFLAAPWIAEHFTALPDVALPAFRWAAITVPFAALAFTYLGATRGLKIMRYTLYAQWIVQPIGWIVFAIVLWVLASATAGWTSAAFGVSWAAALGVAVIGWRRQRAKLPTEITGEGIPQESTGALWRFGALRAPGTLFSQLIFWTDLFVLSLLVAGLGTQGANDVGVYSGVLRAGQSLFLFLTSVSLTFSPFVADLHHRGETRRLDSLYKQVSRWTLTATIPVVLVLAVAPEQVLRVFGAGFGEGAVALRVIIVGMVVPVMVGTVGFILIMAGRTGWDLVVYMGAFAIDIGLSLALARPSALGIVGAAIAQAATLTFSAVARLFLVKRFLDIWPFDRSWLRLVIPTLIGAAVMAAVHLAVPSEKWLVSLAATGVIGGLAYVVAVIAIGLPTNERTALFRLPTKLRSRS
jgi:O-antigen/teichoic acid export membrane protein